MTNTSIADNRPKARKPKSPHSLKGGSGEANRLAVAILEVLAGLRTPTDAAEALQISLPRYYQLETRALEGLVAACESKQRTRRVSLETRIGKLEDQLAQAQAECARQQALVRAAQRTIGLKAAAPPEKKPVSGVGVKRRPRRPAVRALKAVAVLRKNARDEHPADVQTRVSNRDLSVAGCSIDARTQDHGTTAGPAPGGIKTGKGPTASDSADSRR